MWRKILTTWIKATIQVPKNPQMANKKNFINKYIKDIAKLNIHYLGDRFCLAYLLSLSSTELQRLITAPKLNSAFRMYKLNSLTADTEHRNFNWPYFVGSEKQPARPASQRGSQKLLAGGLTGRNACGTCRLCYVTEVLPREQGLLLLPGPARALHASQSCPFGFDMLNCACDEGTSMWRAHLRCRALFCCDCIG